MLQDPCFTWWGSLSPWQPSWAATHLFEGRILLLRLRLDGPGLCWSASPCPFPFSWGLWSREGIVQIDVQCLVILCKAPEDYSDDPWLLSHLGHILSFSLDFFLPESYVYMQTYRDSTCFLLQDKMRVESWVQLMGSTTAIYWKNSHS